MPVRQGRLQPPGPVRLLHRLGRRRPPRVVRHAGPSGRRAPGHHPRRAARRARVTAGPTPSSGRGASQCGFCTPGHPHASGRARERRGAGRRTRPVAARGRGRAPGPPVSLHRLAVHRRGGAATRSVRDERVRLHADGPAERATPCSRRGAPRSRERLPGLGPRGRARRRRLRRRRRPGRTRWSSSARPRRPRRGLRAARAGDRTGPGPQQHGAALAPGGGAAGHVGAHAADDLGRAGLRRARRQLVPPRAPSRPRRWPTAARSAASATARCPARARRLADETGGTVRVLWRREDVVRRGPKRPPLAVALRADGSGVVRVGSTPGSPDLAPLVARLRRWCPGVEVEEVEVRRPAGRARAARRRVGRGVGGPAGVRAHRACAVGEGRADSRGARCRAGRRDGRTAATASAGTGRGRRVGGRRCCAR